jgi:hypothetical protein
MIIIFIIITIIIVIIIIFFIFFNNYSYSYSYYHYYLQNRPNPDDAGPIVRRPMGLPITTGCHTAWIRTRVSVVTPQAAEP